jgi:hypothetical protein
MGCDTIAKDSAGSTKITEICWYSLNYLCDLSLEAGISMDRLKWSIVKPHTVKAISLCITSNYGLISLLTAFSKVFEKVMYKHVMCLLNCGSVVVKERFGFRKTLSINEATCNLAHKILKALSSKFLVAEILCHCQGFLLWHMILFTKLPYIWLDGSEDKLIIFCKQEIDSCDEVLHSCSNWGKLQHGIPQCSIIDPLFSVVYISYIMLTMMQSQT